MPQRMTLRSLRGAPGYIVTCDGQSRIFQTDWDWPSLAQSFGWSLREVQWPAEDSDACDHRSTDGTIACPDCGMPVSKFIQEASWFLDDHLGIEAEDPGYFQE